MANNRNVHHTELPKLTNSSTNNNYGEWKTKSYHKLCKWDLLKYVEGPDSDPPNIPPLHPLRTYHGVNDEGHLSTTHILGNAVKHEQALMAAKPWITGDHSTLSHIIVALPANQLHLMQHVQHAKQARDNLHSHYQPRNLLCTATIKSQLITYCCTPDMNLTTWLTDLQKLYNSLCNLGHEHMSDHKFALTILDLMLQDDGWTNFVSGLQSKVHNSNDRGLPISFATFITAINNEYWYQHKDNHQTSSLIFSARFKAQKCSNPKRPCTTDVVASSTASPTPTKCVRTVNPSKAHLRCTNQHCKSKIRHDSSDCIAYMGTKQNQYRDWWKGLWNIHLPEAQHSKDNNMPPKNHPLHRHWQVPTVHQTNTADNSLDCSTTAQIHSTDSQANSSLAPDIYAWNTILSNYESVA